MKKSAVLLGMICVLGLAACGKPAPIPEGSGEVLPPETVEEYAPQTELPPEEAPLPDPEPERAEYILVRTDGLNIRTGAGTEYPSLGQAQKNILLRYDGAEGGWLRTRYRGKTAFVSGKTEFAGTMSMNRGEEIVERVIEEGLDLLGTPYVFGAVRLTDGKGHFMKGFTAEAFDCSSLMQYIFYRGAGVELDVTTRTQILQGEAVPREELRRGDLMFFTNASRCNRTGIERVGHVALYLGDNYILHTASDFAKVEQISPARWAYFLAARRVI